MLARFKIAFVAVICLMTCGVTACGGWHEFVERSKLDWHRNNAWPEPWLTKDKIAVCSPFVIMAQNGWRQESTLRDLHFDSVTQSLTEAGQLKVQHILMNQPKRFRTVYVSRSINEEKSAARMDSVQQLVSKVIVDGAMPAVVYTDFAPRAWPASQIDLIGQKYNSSIPDPRLPEFEATTN